MLRYPCVECKIKTIILSAIISITAPVQPTDTIKALVGMSRISILTPLKLNSRATAIITQVQNHAMVALEDKHQIRTIYTNNMSSFPAVKSSVVPSSNLHINSINLIIQVQRRPRPKPGPIRLTFRISNRIQAHRRNIRSGAELARCQMATLHLSQITTSVLYPSKTRSTTKLLAIISSIKRAQRPATQSWLATNNPKSSRLPQTLPLVRLKL